MLSRFICGAVPILLIHPVVGAQQPAVDLVSKAVASEAASNKNAPHTSFISHERSTRTGGHLWVEKVVETNDGDLRRLLSEDGNPISPAKAKAEDERLAHIAAHPDAFRRANQPGKNDGKDNSELMRAIPRMFLFRYDGEAGACTKVHFEPNPAFTPATYEQRVVHALKGTILIEQPADRLCGIDAQIAQTVDFGYGLLGRVEPGGTIRMELIRTPWEQWVTNELHIHVSARILLLKNLSKEEDDTRTDFVRLPPRLTLAQSVDATRP